MKVQEWVLRNRWFTLAVLFFLVNSYAVFRYDRSRGERGPVRVVLEKIEGGVKERDALTWQFAAPMVPTNKVGRWTNGGPVEFHPTVDGLFCWAGPAELRFVPRHTWPCCTAFTATLSGRLRSTDLRLLESERVFSFESERLKIRRVTQVDYGEHPRIRLEFNDRVSCTDLRSHLSIRSPKGQSIRHRVHGTSADNTVEVTIYSALPSAELHIGAGLTGLSGPLGLAYDYSTPIGLSRKLLVEEVSVDDDSLDSTGILVSFNRPIDLSDTSEFIAVEPAVPFAAEPYYRGSNRIRLHGDFEHGMRYTIRIARGLRSRDGVLLDRAVSRAVYFGDARPELEFAAQGHYLSPRGSMVLPLKMVNVAKYDVTVQRVYANNIVPLAARQTGGYRMYYGPAHQGLTEPIAEREVTVDAEHNHVVEQVLELRPLIGDKRGAFYVRVVTDSGCTAAYHFVVSDTGVTVRRSETELLVWANSLHTLAAVADADVRVLSLENQLLASGKTDATGICALRCGTGQAGGEPFVATVSKGEDTTYLVLDAAKVALRGGVGERPYLTRGYEAYVFTDRGVFRPGERCHVQAVVRGRDFQCPAPFPVRLDVYRPDGEKERTLPGMLTDYGSAEFVVPWPDYAATGRYRLRVCVPGQDTPIGKTSVAVEEFVPPQIRVEVKTAQSRATAAEDLDVAVASQYLFGRPAAGLRAEARVEFAPRPFAPRKWPAYHFGDPTRSFGTVRKALGHQALDADGSATFSTRGSEAWAPPAALKMLAVVTVKEMSGRSVTGYSGRMLDVYPFYIGIRGDEAGFEPGQARSLDIVCVHPDESVADECEALDLRIEKLVWTSVLKADASGNYRYYSEEQAIPLREESVRLAGGRATARVTVHSEGTFRLTVSHAASRAASSIAFEAWHGARSGYAWSMASPDRVELALDKDAYAAGETARLLLKAPFAGKALVTVESTNVLHREVVTLTNNTAEVSVPVAASYAPNVYCTVSLIRPVVAEKTWGPHRAAGMVPLLVKQPERKLTVRISAPEAVRPRRPLVAHVQVADDRGNPVQSEIVVAAVDEAICMLSDFVAPDPYAHFTVPRLPAFTLSDLYTRLIPEREYTALGEASLPGGGAGMLGALRSRLSPIKARRFRPTALWAGTRVTDPHGTADVHFELPEFTGQLRLMVVALARERMGAASRNVIVKRPLIVQSSLPRFAAPNDVFTMPLTVINETGQGGEAEVQVRCGGPLTVDADTEGTGNASGVAPPTPTATAASVRIPVKAGETVCRAFRLKAGYTPGKATCRMSVRLGDEAWEEETELPVRPPYPLVARMGSGRVDPGKAAKLEIPAPWVETTGRTEIRLSALPNLQLAGGLDYLLRYPYGCLEQTTSQSFPLLHLADLAELLYPGWVERDEVDHRVRAGLERVLSMQRSDGSFGLWPGANTYVWGTLYATHFLVEAKKAGHDVPQDRLQGALDFIETWLARQGADADDTTFYNQTYACYVLALGERPAHGWTNRLMERSPELHRGDKVQLAAALVAAGRRRDALAYLQTLGAQAAPVARELGGSLRSNVKDDALLLSSWLSLDPRHAMVPVLVRRVLAGQTSGRWYTTHENAMALAALGKYARVLASASRQCRGSLAWNGNGKDLRFDTETQFHSLLQGYRGAGATLRNTGEGPVFYYWKSEGIPADGNVPVEDRGLRVRRELLDLAGRPLDNDVLAQGDLYLVMLTIDTDRALDNIVVQDLLPAGLEVENTRLKTSEAISWIKTKQTLPVLHSDVRDDRLVAFTGPFSGTKQYCYAARAVTAGDFVLPPVSAECMYDDSIRSVHGAGRVEVK